MLRSDYSIYFLSDRQCRRLAHAQVVEPHCLILKLRNQSLAPSLAGVQMDMNVTKMSAALPVFNVVYIVDRNVV